MNLTIIILFVVLLLITPSFSTSDIDSDEADNYVDIEINQRPPVQKFRPYSCRDVVSNKARVIVILFNGLEVMCDTKTDGGGWTIFQRRFNGHLNFYRGWDEYKYGFGDLAVGEFYLGNEHIHRMTVQARHELRVDMKILSRGKNGDPYYSEYLVDGFYARYARFCLNGEAEGYRLKVKDYYGNAGDGLSYHHDAVFGTYDHNPREGQSLCAQNNKGAWWYQPNDQAFRKEKWKTLCHDSNLNGLWNNTELYKGMNWYDLTKFNEFVSFTEMKFREISKV